MKSSIMHLMSLFLLLSFAAACGNKSSGGSKGNSSSNLNTVGNFAGEKAYNNLKAWQAGTAEASTVGTHLYYLKKQVEQQMFSINKSMCQKSVVVVDCLNPTGCFKHTNNGIFKGTVVMNNTSFLGTTIKRYGDCDINSSFNLYTKAGNLELKEAVLGTGKFLIKSLTQQTGSIYTVYYGDFAGSLVPTSYTVINTSLPSILNPTEVGSVSNGYKKPTSKLYEFNSGL